jgi:uncharacterized membrane protein
MRVDQRTANWRGAAALPLLLLLFFTFLARFALAGVQSYWLDELYSVYLYAEQTSSVGIMVSRLARTSIHPPLYQIILYEWIKLFGSTEAATRTLSNLYVTGATLLLFLLVRCCSSERRAYCAVIIFSLMHASVFYGMETRSYAQSMFLASASSFAFFFLFQRIHSGRNLNGVLFSKAFAGLILANTGLLFTHYYNVFFLAGQGLFLAVAWLALHRQTAFWRNAVGIATVGLAPIILLLVVWGPTMLRSFQRFSGKYEAEGGTPTVDPLLMMKQMTLDYNVVQSPVVLAALLLLIALYFLRFRRSVASGKVVLTSRPLFDYYFLVSTILPFFFAYLLFLVSSQERLAARYFTPVAPGLAVLLGIAFEQALALIGTISGRLRRRLISWSVPLCCAFSLVVVGPGALRAIQHEKHNWRRLAQDILNLKRQNPEKRYVIYEAGFRRRPLLNHYFIRSGSDLRVTGTLLLRDDLKDSLAFGKEAQSPDTVVVLAFPHVPSWRFKNVLNKSSELFLTRFEIFDRRGNGYVLLSQ